MSTTISNTDDVIDSRDVISRIDTLRFQLESEFEAADIRLPFGQAAEFDDWIKDEDNSETPDDVVEFRALVALAEQCENYGDWEHGETLIHRSHFVKYIEELIDDCYDMPKEMTSGNWPYRHITIDYEAAAEEAEHDYIEVDFAGQEYLMRA